jgi:hypothetical protein
MKISELETKKGTIFLVNTQLFRPDFQVEEKYQIVNFLYNKVVTANLIFVVLDCATAGESFQDRYSNLSLLIQDLKHHVYPLRHALEVIID